MIWNVFAGSTEMSLRDSLNVDSICLRRKPDAFSKMGCAPDMYIAYSQCKRNRTQLSADRESHEGCKQQSSKRDIVFTRTNMRNIPN